MDLNEGWFERQAQNAKEEIKTWTTTKQEVMNGEALPENYETMKSRAEKAEADLELYKGLLSAEQEDCQLQRTARNELWKRAAKLETELAQVKAERDRLREALEWVRENVMIASCYEFIVAVNKALEC